MAFVEERVSVRHLVCCDTLFKGRLTRLTRFKVAVSQGSIREFNTTLGDDRGAKAAADEGSRTVGIMIQCGVISMIRRPRRDEESKNKSQFVNSEHKRVHQGSSRPQRFLVFRGISVYIENRHQPRRVRRDRGSDRRVLNQSTGYLGSAEDRIR